MNNIYIHPMSIVETTHIGAGTRIWAFTHILAGTSIGKDCNIGEHCFVEGTVSIGDNVTIKNGNMIWEGVTLEDGVFVGPHVSFTNDSFPRSPRLREAHARYSNPNWLVPTRVRYGASIGAGAVILAGSTIGEFALVGAGAIVVKEVPSHALVVGNPAKIRGWVCRCGHPLAFRGQTMSSCVACGLAFIKCDNSVTAMK